MRTRLAVLGSTGSIGRQTLEVVDAYPERFDVVALAAGRNFTLLQQQVERYRPALVSVAHADDRTRLRGPNILFGEEGLVAVATHPEVDLVVVATSGHAAIRPTLAALASGKTVALANKEAVVCAGELIMDTVRRHGAQIRPIDSEHSGLWQCLAIPHRRDELARVTLTASGGPFRDLPRDRLDQVTASDALAHPIWNMGDKITVDSATLMNKGLEVIEAHWLFDLSYDQIDVLVHPQSIVHAFVTFRDGSVLAQLACPDMRLPIQYALTYPERLPTVCPTLDLASVASLTFYPPDLERFPALQLAIDAGRAGATYPTVLSSADEVAVAAFLRGDLRFTDIAVVVRAVLERHRPSSGPLTLDDIAAADSWARREAERCIAELRVKR